MSIQHPTRFNNQLKCNIIATVLHFLSLYYIQSNIIAAQKIRRTLQMHANKIVQISRADDIRPYMIVLICNIMMAVCHRYLYLQAPIYQVDLTICFCTLNSILLCYI